MDREFRGMSFPIVDCIVDDGPISSRYDFLAALNPICLRDGVGCSVSLLSSSNTTLKYLSCVESFRITAANFRFSSSFDSNIWRSFTNARMMVMLTSIARSLFSTLDNIATPCSVKAYGSDRRPRFRLRFTCSLRRCVGTPYNSARSTSIMTLWPRNK